MINFQSPEWRKTAHYSLKKDMEQKVLVFPQLDTLVMAQGEIQGKKHETLDDVCYEIEECKRETICIKRFETSSGQESWDVPQVKIISHDGSKSKLKKDRFTSLLLANYGVRILVEDSKANQPIYYNFAGRAGTFAPKQISGPTYIRTGNKNKSIKTY